MQNVLFHEDFADALRHLVKALGGFDTVGSDLWPAKGRRQAGIQLSDCLNAERPAKLGLDEVTALLRLGRAAGEHVALHALCDLAGYQRPDIAQQKHANRNWPRNSPGRRRNCRASPMSSQL